MSLIAKITIKSQIRAQITNGFRKFGQDDRLISSQAIAILLLEFVCQQEITVTLFDSSQEETRAIAL